MVEQIDRDAAAKRYKKTATITAVRWWKDGDHPAVIRKVAPNRYADEGIPWIETLEGGHVVTPGDWIATGVNGEHWPIKPDIFAKTYVLDDGVDAAKAAEARMIARMREPDAKMVGIMARALRDCTCKECRTYATALFASAADAMEVGDAG